MRTYLKLKFEHDSECEYESHFGRNPDLFFEFADITDVSFGLEVISSEAMLMLMEGFAY